MENRNAKIVETHSASAQAPFPNMVWIPEGTFLMGSNRHYPEEAPAHPATVSGFWMDCHTVTNRQYQAFVAATGHVTVAERAVDPADYPGAPPELLQPASVVFRRPPASVDLRNHLNWWHYVRGADWRHPQGPDSSLRGLDDHPVVHVTLEDALAYAAWAGKALPTEAEWERAARGGLEDAEYVWGNEWTPEGKIMANTWQGLFPVQNLAADGFEGTAPVGSFPANGYGLHDMAGNVWQWTTDWYGPHEQSAACCGGRPSEIEAREASCDQSLSVRVPRNVIKGGSFLCAPNYCRRYRPAARMGQQTDSATSHLGFRCVVRG